MKKQDDYLWCLVLIFIVLMGAYSYFSIPDVYWSTSSDRCVKVMHDGIEMDCSNLPEKYNRVWVK